LVLSLAILRKSTLCSAVTWGSLVEAKYNPAAAIGLDRKLQCAIRGTSNLKEKFAEVFGLLRDPVYQYLVTLLGSREEAELGAIQGGGK
jgi:hypothetical protein